ncbi:unnamed protein product, partial [Mesorhabditis spiculigera]
MSLLPMDVLCEIMKQIPFSDVKTRFNMSLANKELWTKAPKIHKEINHEELFDMVMDELPSEHNALLKSNSKANLFDEQDIPIETVEEHATPIDD